MYSIIRNAISEKRSIFTHKVSRSAEDIITNFPEPPINPANSLPGIQNPPEGMKGDSGATNKKEVGFSNETLEILAVQTAGIATIADGKSNVPVESIPENRSVEVESTDANDADALETDQVQFPHPPKQKPLGLSLASDMQDSRSLYICYFRNSRHMRVYGRVEVQSDMTDKNMFLALRDGYRTQLQSFWNRWFGLKGLKNIVVLEVKISLLTHRKLLTNLDKS